MPRIITIANQKGGVGKTTTAINLAASLAFIGFEVLLIDIDAQGNATSGLGIDKNSLEKTIYHVLLGEAPIESVICSTAMDNLDIVPANVNLVGAEVELVSTQSREFRLKEALSRITRMYDYIIIDCPPSLGLLTLNSFTATQSILIPVQCEYYALEGLGQLMHTIEAVKANLNPELMIEGMVLTMFDSRTNLAEQVVANVQKHFPGKVYQSIIPRNVKLSEAPSFGKPVILHDRQSKGAQSYLMLAKEVSGTTETGVPA